MKKILILVMMMMMFAVVAEGSELHGDASISYVPEYSGFDISISLNYDLMKNWNVYGTTDVLFDFTVAGLRGTPYRAAYMVGTKVKFLERFYIGLQRMCTHPVYSNKKQFFDKFAGGNRTDLRMGITW